MADVRFLQVEMQALKIRETAGGKDTYKFLARGEIIEVDYDNREVKDSLIWVKHRRGWTAIRPENLGDGERAYVRDITHTVPAKGQLFKVIFSSINIRKSPNGEKNEYMLKKGDVIIANIASGGQPTDGGYTWWQHSLGWSSSQKLNSTQYMEDLGTISNARSELTSPPAPLINPSSSEEGVIGTTPEKKEADPTSLTTGSSERKRYYYLVIDPPTARDKPYGDRYGYTIGENTVFSSYQEAPQSNNRHYWIQHVGGAWAASGPLSDQYAWLKPIDESEASKYLPSLVTAENINELPQYRSLFSKLPAEIPVSKGYFQYFGNNVFAVTHGSKFGYDGYSQGLHGGLDFGNKSGGQDIFAGVDGKVTHIIDKRGIAKNQVWVETTHYRVIYQHLQSQSTMRNAGKNPPKIGDTVTPDTYIGTYSDPVSTGMDHLHLEVRYLEFSNRKSRHKELIINPLELMPDALIQTIFDNYNPSTARVDGKSKLRYFYKTDSWSKWTTPLDQPVIQWAKPVIGPKA